MATHYHSIDLVNGDMHIHEDVAALDQYLKATVTDDARDYIVRHAGFYRHGESLGTQNAMRVTVCTDDFQDCAGDLAEALTQEWAESGS